MFGDATGGKWKDFTVDGEQPAPEAKSAGREVRAEFRAKLAEKLDKVAQVYDDALDNEDDRVRLVAAKQISVELWGQPTQPLSGDDEKGPLTVVVRRFTDVGDDAA